MLHQACIVCKSHDLQKKIAFFNCLYFACYLCESFSCHFVTYTILSQNWFCLYIDVMSETKQDCEHVLKRNSDGSTDVYTVEPNTTTKKHM